jgi:hypothetical protein
MSASDASRMPAARARSADDGERPANDVSTVQPACVRRAPIAAPIAPGMRIARVGEDMIRLR